MCLGNKFSEGGGLSTCKTGIPAGTPPSIGCTWTPWGVTVTTSKSADGHRDGGPEENECCEAAENRDGGPEENECCEVAENRDEG